jgi:hypothetical protein
LKLRFSEAILNRCGSAWTPQSGPFLRSQALVGSAQGRSEQQAISDAMRTLRTIQKEKLGYPGLE